MNSTQTTIQEEKEIINKIFSLNNFDVPTLPAWIDEVLINYWRGNLFHFHYLPNILIDEKINLPADYERPGKYFLRQIQKGNIPTASQWLPGKWILIDGRDKPEQKVAWINSHDMKLLEKIGWHPKNHFKKWQCQPYQQEYLSDILQSKEFGSRFCLSINDIEEIKPFIHNFLRLPAGAKIRLPTFMEYNYLGNIFYKQWATTSTWEWFEDKFKDRQNLAGGSDSLGCCGSEPPDFWSTILSFRPLVEL